MAKPPRWVWLYIPIVLFVLLHVLAVAASDFYLYAVIPEDGIVEYATPILLLIALGIALSMLRSPMSTNRWMRVWLSAFAIGCLYFAGEEVSWGQRIFGWSTPEEWSALNKQKETNLHNLAGIFDSKPKLLVTLGMLVGGIIYPLSARARQFLNRILPPVFWPTSISTPSAVCALTVGIPERIAVSLGMDAPAWLAIAEPGEVKELYVAMFLLLYAISLSRKLRG